MIRKHIGYRHTALVHAEAFDQFYRQPFNPQLDFRRPCEVPELVVDARENAKRRYRWYAATKLYDRSGVRAGAVVVAAPPVIRELTHITDVIAIVITCRNSKFANLATLWGWCCLKK